MEAFQPSLWANETPVLLTTDLGPRPCALCHRIPPFGLDNIAGSWQVFTEKQVWLQALICKDCHDENPYGWCLAWQEVRNGVREYIVKENEIEGWEHWYQDR